MSIACMSDQVLPHKDRLLSNEGLSFAPQPDGYLPVYDFVAQQQWGFYAHRVRAPVFSFGHYSETCDGDGGGGGEEWD